MRMYEIATNTIKWFKDFEGFGFVTPHNSGDDLFAHLSTIIEVDYQFLIISARQF